MNEPLGVGHQPQHATGRVAQPGDPRRRTIGIVGGIVRQGDLAPCPPAVEDRGRIDGDPALGMRHRQFQLADSPQKHRLALGDLQLDPAAGVTAIRIPREGGVGRAGHVGGPRRASPWQHPGLDQHLEAIADAQRQLVSREELSQHISEVRPHLGPEDHPGPHVVAVAEPPRDAQNLEVAEQLGLFEQAEQVNPFGATSAMLEDPGGLDIAVGSRSPQHQHAGSSHATLSGTRRTRPARSQGIQAIPEWGPEGLTATLGRRNDHPRLPASLAVLDPILIPSRGGIGEMPGDCLQWGSTQPRPGDQEAAVGDGVPPALSARSGRPLSWNRLLCDRPPSVRPPSRPPGARTGRRSDHSPLPPARRTAGAFHPVAGGPRLGHPDGSWSAPAAAHARPGPQEIPAASPGAGRRGGPQLAQAGHLRAVVRPLDPQLRRAERNGQRRQAGGTASLGRVPQRCLAVTHSRPDRGVPGLARGQYRPRRRGSLSPAQAVAIPRPGREPRRIPRRRVQPPRLAGRPVDPPLLFRRPAVLWVLVQCPPPAVAAHQHAANHPRRPARGTPGAGRGCSAWPAAGSDRARTHDAGDRTSRVRGWLVRRAG